MLGDWLAEFTDLRNVLVRPPWPSHDGLRDLTAQLRTRIIATGRNVPVPVPSDRKRAAAERAAAITAAQAEQAREDVALHELNSKVSPACLSYETNGRSLHPHTLVWLK